MSGTFVWRGVGERSGRYGPCQRNNSSQSGTYQAPGNCTLVTRYLTHTPLGLLELVYSAWLTAKINGHEETTFGQPTRTSRRRNGSHPTVGVARLGREFSYRLSSPSEEPAVRVKILLVQSF